MIKILPLGSAPWARDLADSLTNGPLHYLLYVGMIFFFSYFWVSSCSTRSRSRKT